MVEGMARWLSRWAAGSGPRRRVGAHGSMGNLTMSGIDRERAAQASNRSRQDPEMDVSFWTPGRRFRRAQGWRLRALPRFDETPCVWSVPSQVG